MIAKSAMDETWGRGDSGANDTLVCKERISMVKETKNNDKNVGDSVGNVQKGRIIHKLKEHGCRITKQRCIILDIILENSCSCCKEIYFRALKQDDKIGIATVYRMINMLEEIGEINRENVFKISHCQDCIDRNVCSIEFEDDSVIELSEQRWNQIIEAGLSAYGYTKEQNIRKISMNPQ